MTGGGLATHEAEEASQQHLPRHTWMPAKLQSINQASRQRKDWSSTFSGYALSTTKLEEREGERDDGNEIGKHKIN